MLVHQILQTISRPTIIDKDLAKRRRSNFLTTKLTSTEKMELYECGVNGDLKKLLDLISKKNYNLLEECSAGGYYWTCLHYACHYGHINIIQYFIDYYKNNPYIKDIFNLQSNLGMSPIMIALNNGPGVKKKAILELFIQNDLIDYDICNNKGEDVFSVSEKVKLLDYFISLLKED